MTPQDVIVSTCVSSPAHALTVAATSRIPQEQPAAGESNAWPSKAGFVLEAEGTHGNMHKNRIQESISSN